MSAIILAAGQGTRMNSDLPKVMHTVCGRPMVHFSVQAALDAGCGEVVVVLGHGRNTIEQYLVTAFAGACVRTTVQEPPRGTGDAARVGLDAVRASASCVLVMNGDVALLGPDELRAVAAPLGAADGRPALSIATCVVADPTGYGRVLRREGSVFEIREHRDLRSPDERAVCEINAGIYAANVAFLRPALASLIPNNAQGELYLTDIVAFAAKVREEMATVSLEESVLLGINDREQLASVERVMQARILRRWRLAGVTIR
ncbi:MAG: NTP transferase domain-containing protein, partial [Myxococcota bacterium]|nr:NTP transferase domain-containing protein [Myxococcota bacterium]